MNTFTGSLQRKGRRYYLVLTTHGRQKWISLKTGNLRVARRRAAQVAPQDATDETDWLAQLVRLGDAARQRLDARKARVPVPWRKLWTAFRQRASAPISATSEASSRRIPLIGCAQACIRRLLAAADDDSPFLFSARTRHCPTKAICRAFRACGIHKRGSGRASFHSLRATFISLMDEAGVPPHVTDAITGHAGGGMHARYTQPSDAALAEAVTRAIPPV